MRVQWLRRNYGAVARRIPLLETGTPRFVDRFSTILGAFLEGYNTVLEEAELDPERVRTRLDERFNDFYRGFAYEGMGMGLGARSLFRFGELRAFEYNAAQVSNAYLYQYYVGLGWWLLTRYGYRAQAYERMLGSLDPLHGPIIFDGVGFRTGMERFASKPQTIARFARFGPVGETVCYQGLGRWLWFQCEFNPMKLMQQVDKLPSEHQADAMSGAGLAAAYSMFDDMEWTCALSAYIPEELRAGFVQGLSFGWEARRLQTPDFEHRVAALTASSQAQITEAIRLVHEVKASVEDRIQQRSLAGENPYVHWIQGVRSKLSSVSNGQGAL